MIERKLTCRVRLENSLNYSDPKVQAFLLGLVGYTYILPQNFYELPELAS